MIVLAEIGSEVNVLLAVLSLIVTAIAAGTAWQQRKTAHEQLRLSLFDSRHRVYSGVVALLDVMDDHVRAPVIHSEAIAVFQRAVHNKEFLFAPDMCAYIDEVLKVAQDLRQLQRECSRTKDRENDGGLFERKEALVKWAVTQVAGGALKRRFSPYLDFSHILVDEA